MKKLQLVCVLSALVIAGCDAGIFNSGCREIGNSGYSLCRSDDGPTVFYLEPNHQAPSGGGLLDGTVDAIGWNDKVIIASRRATFRGDPDGLMVVDLASGKIDGPIDESRVRAKYPRIKLTKATEAWSGQ